MTSRGTSVLSDLGATAFRRTYIVVRHEEIASGWTRVSAFFGTAAHAI